MIFIVDDDDATRDSLRLLLECEGFAARDFASCRQFLAEGRLSDGDCLVLDIHMPGMGGLDLLEGLRRIGNDVPAIVISGRPSLSDKRRAADAGALALVEKPYAIEKLLKLVRRASDQARR